MKNLARTLLALALVLVLAAPAGAVNIPRHPGAPVAFVLEGVLAETLFHPPTTGGPIAVELVLVLAGGVERSVWCVTEALERCGTLPRGLPYEVDGIVATRNPVAPTGARIAHNITPR